MAEKEPRVAITTIDNPYDPFNEWDQWLFYDVSNGYMTCERLATIAKSSNALTEAENNAINDEAFDQMIKTGAFNKNGKHIEYKKVYEEA